MKKIIMAIIGYGKSSQRYHLPFLINKDTFEIKYIYDVDIKKQSIVETEYPNINFTNDINIILEDQSIQLITLCTPPNTHYELAKQCILANKNVVVEKPFCNTVEQANTLLSLANKYQVLVTPFQNRRFDSDYLTLKKVLQYKYVGKPLEIEIHTDYYRPDNNLKKGTSLNGSYYALAIHPLDQVISLFGKPKGVFYDIRNIQNINSTVDDYYDIHLFYQEMKVIIKSSMVVTIAYPKIILHGTNGSYIKYGGDQQENDLKVNISPDTKEFGEDTADQYGIIKYKNTSGDWIEKKISTIRANYGYFYDSIYQTIIHKKEKIVTDKESILAVLILEEGLKIKKPKMIWFDEGEV